jgi:hypothetical protein
MFEEYKKAILLHCDTLRSEGMLSGNISLPTPGKLREECGTVYRSRQLTDSDKQVLRDFFGPADTNGNFKEIIGKVDIDKFRPLNYYLRKPKIETDAKNIELLAWLTDFAQRPFKEENFTKPETPPIKNLGLYFRRLMKLIGKYQKQSALALAGLGLVTVMLIKLFPGKQCMYWAGDHYEAIDCNKQIFGVQSIALDTMKLNHFKKDHPTRHDDNLFHWKSLVRQSRCARTGMLYLRWYPSAIPLKGLKTLDSGNSQKIFWS